MVSQRGSPACEIALHAASEDVYVSPPPRGSRLPGADQTLSGLVELLCPTERTIASVRVSLKGLQTLRFPDKTRASGMRQEEKVVFNKALELTDRPVLIEDPATALPSHVPTSFEETLDAGDTSSLSSTLAEVNQIERPPELAPDVALAESVNVTQEGLQLTPGVHGFEYAFIIPSSTAASFARTPNASLRYILTATAIGAGRDGQGDVSTWKEVHVIAQVQSDGGPTALDLDYRDYHEALGVMSLSLMSASLTVGGVAAVEVHHPDPPPSVTVHAIRVYLEQTLEIFSAVRNQWLKLPTEKLRLWEKGRTPYSSLRPDDVMPKETIWFAQADEQGEPTVGRPGRGAGPGRPSMSPFGLTLDGTFAHHTIAGPPQLPSSDHQSGGYTLQSIFRLPDHRAMRPSTVRGSKTDIRVTHEIGTEVFFSRLGVLDQRPQSETYGLPKMQVFSMRRAVVVPSCACTHDTIHLPPYTLETPPQSRPGSRWGSRTATPRTSSDGRRGSFATLRTSLDGRRGSSATARTSVDGRRGSSTTPDGLLSPMVACSPPPERESRSLRASFSSLRLGRRSRPSSPERAVVNGKKKTEPSQNVRNGTPPLLPLRPILRSRHSSNATTLSKLGRLSPSTPGRGSDVSSGGWLAAPVDAADERTPPPMPDWSMPPPYYGETHTSHARCTCGRGSDELADGEQRLLEGVPTAPGVWLDAPRSDDGEAPPPWRPPSDDVQFPPFVDRERWAVKGGELPPYLSRATGHV